MVKAYTKIDTAAYQAPYEVLARRNRQILSLIVFSFFLDALLFGVFNIQWFATESISAIAEMSESREYNLNGGIWWSLLAVLLFSIALAPVSLAFVMLSYREKDVTDEWIQKVNGLLVSIPTSLIWALLWTVCLPFTWGLLPWGEWSLNWWKIFPYGLGLIWVGGLPLIAVLLQFAKTLRNPEFNHDIAIAKPEQSETVLPTVPISQPTIEIHEAVEGKPITFSIHNRPTGGDAWVGVYPFGSSDHDHGERWKYLRDYGTATPSLPSQPPGDYSIRVFSDGGYNMVAKHKFSIVKHNPAVDKIQSAFKGTAKSGSDFWSSALNKQ